MSAIPYYPMLIDLRGRACLVVGGGPEAEKKTAGLVGSGVNVTVVAEHLTGTLEPMAELGSFRWLNRPFEPSDLDGIFFVVAADEDMDMNRQVAETARERDLLCAVPADPSLGTVSIPGLLQQGKLTLTVDTAGASPYMAGRIQNELAHAFGAEYAQFLDLLEKLKPEIEQTVPDQDVRKDLDAETADSPALSLLRRGNPEAAEKVLRTILSTAKAICEEGK